MLLVIIFKLANLFECNDNWEKNNITGSLIQKGSEYLQARVVTTVNLPKSYKDNNYVVIPTLTGEYGVIDSEVVSIIEKFSDHFTLKAENGAKNLTINWMSFGFTS